MQAPECAPAAGMSDGHIVNHAMMNRPFRGKVAAAPPDNSAALFF